MMLILSDEKVLQSADDVILPVSGILGVDSVFYL